MNTEQRYFTADLSLVKPVIKTWKTSGWNTSPESFWATNFNEVLESDWGQTMPPSEKSFIGVLTFTRPEPLAVPVRVSWRYPKHTTPPEALFRFVWTVRGVVESAIKPAVDYSRLKRWYGDHAQVGRRIYEEVQAVFGPPVVRSCGLEEADEE